MAIVTTQTAQIERSFRAVGAFLLILAIAVVLPAQPAHADLSACGAGSVGGTIYRDQNTNGVADPGEVPYRPVFIDADGDLANDNAVVVNAYDATGALVSTTTSDADGDFTLSGITARVRVEFVIPAHMESAHAGAISASAVQFADPGVCDLAYSVFEPSEYCQADPHLAVPCYAFDDHATGDYAATDVLVSFKASDLTVGPTAIDPTNYAAALPAWQDAPPNKLAVNSEMGTTWGVAYNETDSVIYTAAFLKAGSDYGPGGPGAIYATPIDSATGAATGSATVFYDGPTCDDLHGVDFLFEPQKNQAIHDNAHKCSWGDIQMSPDDSVLYAMDLLTRSVVGIDVASGAVVSTWAVPLDQDTVLDEAGGPSCTSPADDIRPFALGWKDGMLFAGMVCTGESTMTEADNESYVYAVSPATGAFTLVSNWDTSTKAHFNSTYWDSDNRTFLSQLTLSDIVFYGDDMTVAYRDRGSDMAADINDYDWSTEPFSELLCIAWDSATNSYVPEAANQCGSRPGNAAGADMFDSDEFYWGDGRNPLNNPLGSGGDDTHNEIINGGLAQINTALLYAPGTNATDTLVPRSIYTGSVVSLDNETGGPVEAYALFAGRIDGDGSATGVVGKASGLGDIEALCDPAPVEIGNYVWFDIDGDGVQDPDEAPVVGATVNLYDSAGTLVGTTTTGPDGDYYFDVDANTDYVIRMDNASDFAVGGVLDGWAATVADAAPVGDGSDDVRDSDGVAAADGFPEITYTSGGAGENDHTLDFGFQAPFDLALTKQLADGTNLGSFAPGETVTFTIEVFNQGAVDATDIAVVDYVPAGLTLADGNWTDNGDGTATLNTPIAGPLTPATSTTVDISFTIDADASGTLVNWAEIAGASDGDGNPATDIDSTPNTDPADDNQPTGPNDTTDDEIGESGLAGGDEDDHDPAGVTVIPAEGTYSVGNQVWFDDNNNGLIDSGEQPIEGVWVELFTDVDGDGQPDDTNGDGTIDANDAIATTGTDADGLYLFDGLAPGDYIVGIPSMEWDPGAPLDGYLSSGPTSSDPNDDVDNDDNGTPGSFGYVWSGTVTIGDGEPTGENPDNDPNTEDGNENLTVDFGFYQPVFDLALYKQLADGSNFSAVSVGQEITFTLTLTNQGDVTASNITVVDYLPVGLTLADTDWAEQGNGTATTSVVGPLMPGNSATVDITFTVNADANGVIDNWAEIGAATPIDIDGNVLTYPNGSILVDIDSVADAENDDVFETDDDTTGNAPAGGDEDDHDRAQLTIVLPQLAFTGTYSLFQVALASAMILGGALLLRSGSRRREEGLI